MAEAKQGESTNARVVAAPYNKGSREEEAELSLKRTDISRPMAWALCLGFLLTILSECAIQHVVEVRRNLRIRDKEAAAGREELSPLLPHVYSITSLLPSLDDIRKAHGAADWSNLLPSGKRLATFEKRLEEDSEIVKFCRPLAQSLLIRAGAGNEKAYCGRNGWMYFRPEVDFLTAEGFLNPHVLRNRERSDADLVQPDPRKAILHFNKQLAGRGITLIVMPMPSKAVVHPEKFSSRFEQYTQPLQNSSFEQFKKELSDNDVLVFDAGSMLVDRKLRSGEAQFLETDTHWRPEAMEFVAGQLKAFIEKHVALAVLPAFACKLEAQKVENLGDIAAILQLPKEQGIFAKQTVPIHPVRTLQNEPWQANDTADVLLLGDSYTNIFSVEAMGWGHGAGFAEMLSFHLQRPLDRIARNDRGSYATRQVLSAEIAKGNDRLAGKKLVIWEFAVRELVTGDWKLLSMSTTGRPAKQESVATNTFFVVSSGREMRVNATVAAVAVVPTPGTVPYKDHILALHLTNLIPAVGEPVAGNQAVVYMWSMRDNKHTAAAHLRAGDKVNLRLRAWADVSPKLEAINRSELEDLHLQLEDPNWGEEEAR